MFILPAEAAIPATPALRGPEYVGSKLTIECMSRASGACPAGEFLDGLPARARSKLAVVFERLGDAGILRNKTRFKKIDGGIFAIRSDHVRLFCFFTDDRRLVLLHGIKKKGPRLRKKDIEKAKRMRKEFLDNPR